MNINDPFGRMQSRHERNYESLCRSLRKAGLTDKAEALKLQDNMVKRCKIGLAIIIPFTLVLAALLPELWMFTLLFGAAISTWLYNLTKRGKKYVERYIKEELADQDDAAAS
ncbi:MAG: hypothetical protein V7739_19545 [Motiliproteus sp.]